MRFGIGIPTCREGITQPVGTVSPEGLAAWAVEAERLGFDALWADDFRVPSPDMKLPYPEPPNWYEVMVSLAYVSRITSRISMGTGVMVVPLREPVLLAKQAATLDALSNGRFFLGVGLGVSKDEFKRLHPRLRGARRGEIMDECMEGVLALLSQEVASYSGNYFQFDGVAVHPRPAQQRIPLYFVSLATDSPQNLKRLARWGDGVLVSSNPDEARQRVQEIGEAMSEAGRDISEIDIGSYGTLSLGRTRKDAMALYQANRVADRTRAMSEDAIVARHYIGTPSEIVEKVGVLGEAGVTQIVVNTFPLDSMEARLTHLRMYGEEVLAAFR